MLVPLSLASIGQAAAAPPQISVQADGSISIEGSAVPLDALLRALAAQAHWDLAISAPDAKSRMPVTLSVQNRSKDEVIARLGDLSGLDIQVHGGFVSATGVTDEQERHPKRWPQSHARKNDRMVIGQPVTIAADETVDDVVAIGGPLQSMATYTAMPS